MDVAAHGLPSSFIVLFTLSTFTLISFDKILFLYKNVQNTCLSNM